MKAIEPSLGKAEPFRTVRRPSRKTIISLGESLPELRFNAGPSGEYWVSMASAEALTEPSAVAPDVGVSFIDNLRHTRPPDTEVPFTIRRYRAARFCMLAASLN